MIGYNLNNLILLKKVHYGLVLHQLIIKYMKYKSCTTYINYFNKNNRNFNNRNKLKLNDYF